MALIETGASITQVSGQIGSEVYARNRGGAYIRSLGIPNYSNSPYQQTYTNFLKNAVHRWQNTLSDSDRNAWYEYALTTGYISRVGESRKLAGYTSYLKLGMLRSFILGGVFISPPPLVKVNQVVNAVLNANGILTTLDFDYNCFTSNADEVLIIKITPPLSPGITFVNNYMRILTYRPNLTAGNYDILPEYLTRYASFTLGFKIWMELYTFNFNTGQVGGGVKVNATIQ